MKHKKLQKENLKLKTTMTELNECNTELQEQTQSSRRIGELKYRSFKIIQSKEEKRRKRNKEKHLWDTIKENNIHIIGVLEGGERKGQKAYFTKEIKNRLC